MPKTMNVQNLIPFNKRSEAEAREMGRKGGVASGQSRRFAKSLREAYLAELSKESKDGTFNGFELIAAAMVKEAGKGNVGAAKELAHICGEDILRMQVDNTVPIKLVDDYLDSSE